MKKEEITALLGKFESISCNTHYSGENVQNHFPDVGKMVSIRRIEQ